MSSKDDAAFWSIFSYLLSGLVLWGGIGAAVNHFFDLKIAVPIGLCIGMVGSFYLVWVRFLKQK